MSEAEVSSHLRVVDVARRVLDIEKLASDPERAHAAEDNLFIDVLRAIANGRCLDPAWLARTALEACDIEFPRWSS